MAKSIFEKGDTVLLQTVTIYTAGVLVDETDEYFVIGSAASIVATGETRLQSVDNVPWESCEPYPPDALVQVQKSAVVNVTRCGKGKFVV